MPRSKDLPLESSCGRMDQNSLNRNHYLDGDREHTKIPWKRAVSTSSFNNNTWRVLNTHNQFLETSGMFGLLVGIGLVWFLLFPTGFSRQHSGYSGFILTAAIIFATGFFFESLLNRNLGILIFGLCYGLLIKMKTIYDS